MGFISKIFRPKKNDLDKEKDGSAISPKDELDPKVIAVLFSKDEIDNKDYSQLIGAAEVVMNQVLNAKLPSKVRFGINGYDNDESPLWDFLEVVDWARTIMEEHPWLILYIEPQSCLLLAMLCLGGIKSDKYDGYIPNFASQYSEMFLSRFNSSPDLFEKRYGRTSSDLLKDYFDTGSMANAASLHNASQRLILFCKINYASISSQFKEMAVEIENQ